MVDPRWQAAQADDAVDVGLGAEVRPQKGDVGGWQAVARLRVQDAARDLAGLSGLEA